MLKMLPRLNTYDSKRLAPTALVQTPKFMPNRLKDLLSDLSKLNVMVLKLPGETFTQFRNLPFELRTKIWQDAANHPRILLLTDNWHKKAENRESIENHNNVPALLHACSEARKEGLKHYTACTKRCSPHDPIHNEFGHQLGWFSCTAKKVYVNFVADHFLRRTYKGDYISIGKLQLERADLAKIQIVDLPDVEYSTTRLSDIPFFRLLGNLRELNVLVNFNALANSTDRELLMQDLHAEKPGASVIPPRWRYQGRLPNNLQRLNCIHKDTSRSPEEIDPIPTHADFTT
jgi:hypothetical protein